MSIIPIHSYFAFNTDIKPLSDYTYGENEGGIYEVLRVVKSVPLFLEDHLERFFVSAKIAGKKITFTRIEIESILKNLISANNVTYGNILVSCKVNLKAVFISHKYPNLNQYETGVTCGILKGERKNPNAKKFQTLVRKQADKMMANNRYYEVLLVDHLGRITEGSRSNVFFVQENKILTPPGKEVLLGVTRKKAIQLAKELGFPLIESDIFVDQRKNFDAVFLTGTSPKILPVNKVEKAIYNPKNEIVQQLIRSYDNLINEYVKTYNTHY